MHRRRLLISHSRVHLTVWLLAFLFLAGCGAEGQQEMRAPGTFVPMTATALASPTASLPPSATQGLLPTAIAVLAETPTPLPSFRLPSLEDTAAKQALPTAETGGAVTATLPASPESIALQPSAGPADTPAPEPTFTPPALPEAPDGEHYWFQRPVAVDDVVWTNKHYPYGSNRAGQLRTHHGVEFDVGYGTEILAVAGGTVLVAGNDLVTAYGPHPNFYGNLVVIQHDYEQDGLPIFSLYGHLNEVLVSGGERVTAGQPIGLSGASGVADGPHMHFEVRVGENSYAATRNPLLWLTPFPDRGTVAGRISWADGSPALAVPVTLRRLDGHSPYYGTATYADDSVNPDEHWNENFVIDDVFGGFYEVIIEVGEKKFKQEFWVYPYRTSFVELILE